MAIESHVNLARRGAEELNKWVESNPGASLDLSGADLNAVNLAGANLSRANMSDAVLVGARLEGANLSRAVLARARLDGATIKKAVLDDATILRAVVSSAMADGASFVRANLEGANLTQASTQGANFRDAYLRNCIMSEAKAVGAVFSGADLEGASCEGAKLIEADLSCANLRRAHLSRCDLTGANLEGADVQEADITFTFLGGIRGASSSKHLESVKTRDEMYFDTCELEWQERYVDWERIRSIGRLQLFGVSYTLLIYLVTAFYVIGQYNDKVTVIREYFERTADGEHSSQWSRFLAETGLKKLKPFAIDVSSISLLVATIMLVIASGLYALGCPEEIKEFTKAQWCYQLNRSLVHYWAFAWKGRWWRVLCAILYALGGAAFFVITIWKLGWAIAYAIQYVGV